eukprot:614345_1
MSTTPVIESAVKFASGGILLQLKNGNKDINTQYVISQFEPNQPRYFDVNRFSRFSNEDEWLFFGHSVIFEIADMHYMTQPDQIPKNTLNQLNLLQRIIKNKHIKWEDEKKRTRIKSLARRLTTVRQINVAAMEYDNLNDEVDALGRYLTTESAFDNAFIAALDAWYKNNEYDRDSLVSDIGEHGDKDESNLYSFLLSIERPTYFDLIYELFIHQKEQRLKQLKEPYYMKLLHFFTISQTQFISIYKPFHHTFPNKLALQMFKSDDDCILCITKLTDLFYNVQHIQLSGLSQKTMVSFCSVFSNLSFDIRSIINRISLRN